MYDILIRGGLIYDGTGNAPYPGDIGIIEDTIGYIGRDPQQRGKQEIEAYGRAVTPGFIDMHSHADCSVPMWPDMENLLGQGVTTCFSGHCGFGLVPVNRYWLEMDFEQAAMNRLLPEYVGGPYPDPMRALPTDVFRPIFEKEYGEKLDWGDYQSFISHLQRVGTGCNMSFQIGHHQLRQEAMGLDFNRTPTQTEQENMNHLLQEAMEQGAYGLSIGLDYQPGIYAQKDELLSLMEIAAAYGGVVTAHVQLKNRRGDKFLDNYCSMDGFREFLELGKVTGGHIHISHLSNGYLGKLTDDNEEEGARATIRLIRDYQEQGVNVTWDTLGPSTIAMFHFPQLANYLRPYLDDCGGMQKLGEALKATNYGQMIYEEIMRGEHRSRTFFSRIDPLKNPAWADNICIEDCDIARYRGRKLAELAQEEHVDALRMLLRIVQEDPRTLCSKGKRFSEKTFSVYEREDDACFGTDNGCINYGVTYAEKPDYPTYQSTPSAFCGMIRLFEESKLETREALICRLTGNAAKAAGYTDRGILKQGKKADLLILDFDSLRSNFSEAHPQTMPSGIDYVLVNGQIALDHGKFTHVRSGQLISRLS